MFQMSGIGPMQGQANVFHRYLDEKIPIAISRYQNECRRLYEVLDKQLENNKWICGEYSIADIATWPWIARYEWHDIGLKKFQNLFSWYLKIADREAVIKGYDLFKKNSIIPKP